MSDVQQITSTVEDMPLNLDIVGILDFLARRRMEDEVAATQAALEAVENDSLLSPAFSSR